MMHRLQRHLEQRREGLRVGIYSVCSAHPYTLRAAAEQAVDDGSLLLVEATSNQVNQFGGYTGMRPKDFRALVEEIAANAGLHLENVILGGDHLGPNPWQNLPAEEALAHSEDLIAEYVSAGFTKIHLDASMPCVGDPQFLPDDIVAARAVRLCRAAEAARPGGEGPIYVIGTEVPVPGGATHSLDSLQVTSAASAAHTVELHRQAFFNCGLTSAWSRVVALVVQPGVEFAHDSVVDYVAERATALTHWLIEQRNSMVFEAHSTDYQMAAAYAQLVQSGFQILKVGPALTFAMREALFALEEIEELTIPTPERSNLAAVIDAAMIANPVHWQSHYSGNDEELRLLRIFSYSDRIRYYWQEPSVARSADKLFANLQNRIPMTMLSQFFPIQHDRVRNDQIANQPLALVIDRIRDTLREYAVGCMLVDGHR